MKHKDNAKVVDGKLILSFPNAKKPVVWQMDLTEVKASALEVNDNDKDGFALILKTPKGETVEIAPFEKREQAVNGLMAASKALEKAQGQIQATVAQGKTDHAAPIVQAPPQRKSGVLKTLGIILGGIILIFILMNILASMAPRPPGSLTSSQTDTSSSPPPSGVPMSADEFLRRR